MTHPRTEGAMVVFATRTTSDERTKHFFLARFFSAAHAPEASPSLE